MIAHNTMMHSSVGREGEAMKNSLEKVNTSYSTDKKFVSLGKHMAIVDERNS